MYVVIVSEYSNIQVIILSMILFSRKPGVPHPASPRFDPFNDMSDNLNYLLQTVINMHEVNADIRTSIC